MFKFKSSLCLKTTFGGMSEIEADEGEGERHRFSANQLSFPNAALLEGQLRHRLDGRFRRRLFGAFLSLRIFQRREAVFVVKPHAVSAFRQVLVRAGKGNLVSGAGFCRRFHRRQRLPFGGSEDGL